LSSEWDKRFLDEAVNISKWSKDPSTKVGCVITKDRAILSTGYNGLPRGADDSIGDRDVRPEKLFWYEHAERNAIYNAARIGIPLAGSTAYSSLCPCMDCARGLIQSGIQRVVTPEPDWEKYELWAPQFKKAEQLYEECNVKLDYV
jgi:dCMP deaminase